MILKAKYAVSLWTLAFIISATTIATLSATFWFSLVVLAAVSLHMSRHRKYYDRAITDNSDYLI